MFPRPRSARHPDLPMKYQKVLEKNRPSRSDLLKVRKIITGSGAIACAKKEIAAFTVKAKALYADSNMRREYKIVLSDYSDSLMQDPAA